MFPGFLKRRRLLFAGLLIALLCVALYIIGPLLAIEDDDEDLPLDAQVFGPPSSPKLIVSGRVVLERSGSHFGIPRVSPDGTLLAITVVPTGTETISLAEIYLIERATGRVREIIPGHSPRWQTGRSNRLRFERIDADSIRTAVYDTTNRLIIREDIAQSNNDALSSQGDIPVPETIPEYLRRIYRRTIREISDAVFGITVSEYPRTIRVAHHPENNCRRHVPDWQVDEIPFEEYVARSVPSEVPISWPPDALAAQAIATRTYAWYQILRGRERYDVTDWANFQMMCNGRYESTDRAVSMTAGQYLAYADDSDHAPIIAMYSAKNSHPTKDNLATSYLRAVPDETGLGEVLWGHGYGMSQWGAARRATAGQTYRQILGHYYTDVTLQNAQQPNEPIGGFVGLPLNGYLHAGGLRWRALVPAAPLSGTVTLEPGAISLPIRGVWRRGSDLTSGMSLAASLFIDNDLQEKVSLQIDWEPPQPPIFNAPLAVEAPSAKLFVGTPEKDACIGLSSNWIWQGEYLYRTPGETGETGEDVSDAAADNGRARLGRAGVHESGRWYGPYAIGIPHDATYRVLFRLRMGEPARASDGVLPDQPIARLDVTDRKGKRPLGLRDIWPSDFSAVGEYVDIPVDFHLFEPVAGLEFRVEWHGEVDLALDRVQLWQLQLPNVVNRSIDWPLSCVANKTIDWRLSHSGTSTISAIAFDPANNASPVVTRQIEFGSEQPPEFGALVGVKGWWTTLPITISVPVQDYSSGLDKRSGRLLLDDQSRTAQFSQPDAPLAAQKLFVVLTNIPDGTYNVRFQAMDRSGLQRESASGLLNVDRTPPVIRAEAVGERASVTDKDQPGVFNGPVQIVIEAEDTTSGVWGIAYVLNDAPIKLYTEPFTISQEGVHEIRYWAKDKAENYTNSRRLKVWVRVESSESTELPPQSEEIFIPVVQQ